MIAIILINPLYVLILTTHMMIMINKYMNNFKKIGVMIWLNFWICLSV